MCQHAWLTWWGLGLGLAVSGVCMPGKQLSYISGFPPSETESRLRVHAGLHITLLPQFWAAAVNARNSGSGTMFNCCQATLVWVHSEQL